MAKKQQTDDHGWTVGGRRKEEDPDVQFLKLKARKARPTKALLWAILILLLIIVYMLQNPVQQNVDLPTVDYNPAGKQAAYKLTENWLKDNPLGSDARIISWDGYKKTTYKEGDRSIAVYRHDLTVESSLGWWSVKTTVRTDNNTLIGYPSVKRKALPKSAIPSGTLTWPDTLSDATASDALTTLLGQWGRAYVGSDADLLTTIVKDPDTSVKYKPLRLSDNAQVTVDRGRYLNRGTVDGDANTSDRAVFRVNIELGARDGQSAVTTLSYDVVVADPDGSPSIVAWGAPGDGPSLEDYANRKGRQ